MRDFDAPASRQAVWWLLKPEELEPDQKEYARELQRPSPEISSGLKLVKEFQSVLVGKQADRFDQWRICVEQSGLKELQSFSTGGNLVILRPAGSDEGESKRDDRLFSHWRSKQLEPDYAE